MGDFKQNPKKPFEVEVPNKIRKRIAMHHKGESRGCDILTRFPASLKKVLSLPSEPTARKRGSMWSRLMNLWRK